MACAVGGVRSVMAGAMLFLDAVNCDSENDAACHEELQVCKKLVCFKIDTSMDIKAMSESTYCSLAHKRKLQPSRSILHGPGGQVDCKEQFVAETIHKGTKFFQICVIGRSQANDLVSCSAPSRMELIQRINEVSQVFGDIARPAELRARHNQAEGQHRTIQHDDSKKDCLPTPTKSGSRVEEVAGQSDHWESHRAYTDWCPPMVPVLKPSEKIRICVDLKMLNEAVRRECYVLPTLEDTAWNLAGSMVFSSLDGLSRFGRFERFSFSGQLPYGISSTSEVFQREMFELLRGLPEVKSWWMTSWYMPKMSKNMMSILQACSNEWRSLVYAWTRTTVKSSVRCWATLVVWLTEMVSFPVMRRSGPCRNSHHLRMSKNSSST